MRSDLTDPQMSVDGSLRVLKGEPSEGESDREPPLNEDDDDELDDNDQGDEEPQTDHLVLAQFDKVGCNIVCVSLFLLVTVKSCGGQNVRI
jgi:hypothetical protein